MSILQDSLLSNEQKQYIYSKINEHKSSGIEETIAEKLAIEQFKNETALSIQDIFDQLDLNDDKKDE